MVTPADQVPYGEHPLQTLKYFHYSASNEHTLFLLHGGAWRDPNNTYDDFRDLVDSLRKNFSHLPVNLIGINYRLSPEVTHPEHLVDVLKAIEKVSRDVGLKRVHFVGHSVGATLLLQLLDHRKMVELADTKQTVPRLHLDVGYLFLVDGIYDMVDLIEEYGGPYRDFVENAFTSRAQYANASQMTWACDEPFEITSFKPVVVMSRQDELLSLRQTQRFLGFLDARNVDYEYVEEDWGAHEEVYRREELARTIGERLALD